MRCAPPPDPFRHFDTDAGDTGSHKQHHLVHYEEKAMAKAIAMDLHEMV